MKTRAPHGSVGCAMPSVSGRSTPPHAVWRPNAAGPAEPTSATRSPTGRGAADDPPLPPQPLAAAAIAAASSAAAAVAKRPCSARPGTRYDLTRAPGRPAPTGAEGAVRTGGPAPRSRRRRRGAGSGAAPARRAGRGGSARARAAARGPKLFRRSAPKQFPPAWALARGPKLFRRSAPKQFPPAPAPARARGPTLFRPERSKQFPSAAAPAPKLLRPARSKQLPPVPARARPTARAAATPGCPPEGGRAASRRGAPRAARRARSTSPPRRAAPPGTTPRAVRAGAPAAGRRAARTTGADRPPRSAGRCGTRPTRSRRRAASRAPSRRRSRRRRGRLTRAPRRARADTAPRRGTAGPGAWSSSAGLRERGDAELREHRVGHRRRGARERIGAARDLREGDHLADVGLPRHERDETVDPLREAAVRRRAHRERLEQEAELPARFLVRQPHRAEDALLHRHVVDADRARAELPTVPDQVVVLTAHAGRVRLVPLLAARRRRRERMVHERPASVLVLLEQREVGHPVEGLRGRLGELQLPAEVGAQTAEDARDRRLVAGGEQRGRAGRPGERFELALRQELRDRRAHLAALVADDVREPLRPPLLRDLLEPGELRPRERARRDEEADARRVCEHAEPRAARELRRVDDLEPVPEVGLVAPVPRHRVGERQPRERHRGRLPFERLERRDDAALEHVEHVVALGEGHLEVELAELELPVGAKVLVAPAGGDLVVAVDPADHAQLLVELRRLRQREERARLQAYRREEVARALGRAARHARRPDVDEAELVHRPPDRGVREAKVALHPVAAHVEPAVAKAERLVDVLLVELERERRRAGEDAQGVDLELDLARRQVRVHRLGRACDDLALGLQHELVAHLVRGSRGVGRALRVDDELQLARVVAQIDEDEAAVVAARVGPAGHGEPPADVLGARFPAVDVAPAVHRTSVATTSSSATTCSSRPSRRIAASSPRTTTTVRAPVRPACVICPFTERPA